MTAYAYLRKSYIRHADDPGLSPEAQEQAVRRLAERHGDAASLVILSDWDKSGRLGPDKRPGYAALLDAIESGRAHSVYSYSLSRLGRSVPELARLIADCDKRGIPVRLDADNIDTSTASGRLTANILAAIAQFESEVIGERVRQAIAVKASRGERIGTVPFYGDQQGEDVGAVLAAFREAGSYSGAARLLNERGIPTARRRSGANGKLRGWWPSAVAVVVQRLDPSARVRSAGKGARAGGSDFALARLLRCPTCDTLLTGTRDRDGKRVRYSCRLGSVTPHARVSVSEHLILPAIQAEVSRFHPPSEDDAIPGSVDGEGERARLAAERANILDLFQHGDINRPELEARLGEINAAVARLEDRRLAVAIPEIDWGWDARRVNKYLRAMFQRIDLDPETFQPISFDWTVPEWREAA